MPPSLQGAWTCGDWPDHRAAVVALAAAAVLFNPRVDPQRGQVTPVAAAVRALLRGTRLCTETLRLLRNAASASASILTVRRLAHPGMDPTCDEASRPGAVTPVDTALCRIDPADSCAAAAASAERWHSAGAWPLPGAGAAAPGSKGRPNVPAKAVKPHGHGTSAGRGGTAGRRASGVRRARPNVRLPTEGEEASRRLAPQVARVSVVVGHAERAKDAVYVPLSHADIAATKKAANEPVYPVAAKTPGTPAASVRGDSTRTIVRPLRHRHCVSFLDFATTLHHLHVQEPGAGLPLFCVQARDAAWFSSVLAAAGRRFDSAGDWWVVRSTEEPVPEAWRTGNIHRSHPVVLGSFQRGPLHDDRLYRVVAIAQRNRTARGAREAESGLWLERDTFRVLRHRQRDGSKRTFIAYLSARETGGAHGVRGGFLDVAAGPQGGVSVIEPDAGVSLTARTLADAVHVLGRVTGLRYRHGERTGRGDAEEVVHPERARLLYVDPGETLSWTPPHAALPYDSDIALFTPVEVRGEPASRRYILYRNTFDLQADGVAFVDAEGRGGWLTLGAPEADGRCLLHWKTAGIDAFAQAQGLINGGHVHPETVAAQLTASGLVRFSGSSRVEEDGQDRGQPTG